MADYRIAAWTSPPLVSNMSGTVSGLFPQLTRELVQICSGNSSLEVSRHAASPSQLYMENEGNEHFIMPYSKTHTFDFQEEDAVFLPIAVSPCAYYFVDSDLANIPIWEILAITWELLIIMIVSCGYAGVIIWLFDRSSNKDQFPLSFFHGLWEGIWWSFVTMTTVGYGDRYPKSIFGRVFAMLWILVGIVIISVFTAGLTTALSSEDSGKKIISGKTVGVLDRSEEQSLAIAMGAKTIGYPDLETLTARVEEKGKSSSQTGFIIDSLHALHLADEIKTGHFKVQEKIDRTIVFGILVQGVEPSISKCMHKLVLKKKYEFHHLLKEGEKDISDAVYFHGEDTLYMLLHANEVIVLIYALVLISVICAIAAWHMIYWRPRHTKQSGFCRKFTACVRPEICGEIITGKRTEASNSDKDNQYSNGQHTICESKN